MPNKTCYIINNIISRLFAPETAMVLIRPHRPGVQGGKNQVSSIYQFFLFCKKNLCPNPSIYLNEQRHLHNQACDLVRED